MIGSLQIQAYRATKDPKYADRAAMQLAAYLDKLQKINGLFYHGPEAPYYWAGATAGSRLRSPKCLVRFQPDHPNMRG